VYEENTFNIQLPGGSCFTLFRLHCVRIRGPEEHGLLRFHPVQCGEPEARLLQDHDFKRRSPRGGDASNFAEAACPFAAFPSRKQCRYARFRKTCIYNRSLLTA
jgi:hypothetical protein